MSFLRKMRNLRFAKNLVGFQYWSGYDNAGSGFNLLDLHQAFSILTGIGKKV